MKIGILHHDLEWVEKEFKKQFSEKGIITTLHHINNTSLEKLSVENIILNRVYASVANRDYKSNIKTLNLLKSLEDSGKVCYNSFDTTAADYSKFAAYKLMERKNIPTPETIFLSSEKDIKIAEQFAEDKNYPIILKRDMGGRGKDVIKINDHKTLYSHLERIFSEKNLEEYGAGWILQEYAKSIEPNDSRITILNGQHAFSYQRSLIAPEEGDDYWMASVSKGSIRTNYQPSENELELAINATKSIGAIYNSVDMMHTKNGPVIIENNPTPNYGQECDDNKQKISTIINLILGQK